VQIDIEEIKLIDQIRNKDQQAFRSLFDCYYKQLYQGNRF